MKKMLVILMLPILASVLYACANTTSIARVHPEEVKGIPNCSECHSNAFGAMNHQALDFYAKHGLFAKSARQSCAACHQESFCSDCHAHKTEFKPSDKFADSPERNLPHRGDYLSQHKIDGRMNPASCAKCHGRQNNAGCASCHR